VLELVFGPSLGARWESHISGPTIGVGPGSWELTPHKWVPVCGTSPLGYWLARKYRLTLRDVIKRWVKYPKDKSAKTWTVYGKGRTGRVCGAVLQRMLGAGKKQFRWKTPSVNPYLMSTNPTKILESNYREVVTAMS